MQLLNALDAYLSYVVFDPVISHEEVCYDERVKVCENFWKEDGYGGKIWSEDPSKCHWLDHSQCVKTPKPKKVKLQMI